MFNVYVREDDMGGEVFIEKDFPTATEAEAFAFQQLTNMLATTPTPITLTGDGGFGNGEDDTWGGEITLSSPAWEDNDLRMVCEVTE
jgi:hypothetical protein